MSSLVLHIITTLPCCSCLSSSARPSEGLARSADQGGPNDDEERPSAPTINPINPPPPSTKALIEMPDLQVPQCSTSPPRTAAPPLSSSYGGRGPMASSNNNKREEQEDRREDDEDEEVEEQEEETPPRPPPPPPVKKATNNPPITVVPTPPPASEPSLKPTVKSPALTIDTRPPPPSPKVAASISPQPSPSRRVVDKDVVEEVEGNNAQEIAAKNFITALEQGIVVIKHDRKGRSRLRELYSSDGGVSFSWREPSKRGHEKKLSSGGRNRVDYAFDQVMEIRRGTVPDPSGQPGETGTSTLRASCEEKDLHKSFSIICQDRSVDLTCHSIEQMTFLLKGFTAVVAQRKAIAKRKLAAVY